MARSFNEMRREIEGRSDQGRSRVESVRPRRFCWGYISLDAKHRGECEECGGEIKAGERAWWHPTTKAMRCSSWLCRPTHETFRDNEIVVWHIKEGQFEPWYLALREEAIERARLKRERVLGVAWLAGEEPGYEPLDESSTEEGDGFEPEAGVAEDPTGMQAGEEEETSSTSSSLSEDVANARKLTSKDELLARPFESVFQDVQKTLDYHVRWSVNKSAGHFDRDDLTGVVYLKLVEAMESFSGAGTFGAYLDAVIPNALVDFARKELPYDQMRVPFDDEAEENLCSDPTEDDPTDDWINCMEIRACLAKTPNADLLVLGGLGFRSRELGPKSVIDMRRSRARTTVAEMLRTRGL